MPRETATSIAALWSRKSGRWLCILAAAQVSWYAIATAFSTRPWFSLLGTNWRRMGLMTVLALALFCVLAAGHLCRRPELLTAILRAFVVAAIIASIYGIAQYFDIDPLQSPLAYHAQAGPSTIVRPPGTLGHADYFGWWLAIAMFIGVGLVRTGSGLWRRASVGACLLTGVAIILSGTRSAILAAVAGFVVLIAVSGFRPARRHWMTALLCAGILLAFYISPAGTRLRARVRWSGDEPVGGGRPLLWRDSLRMSAARPLVGFGPETFEAEFPRHESPELSRVLPDFYYESPHNTALDALTGEGIPGMLIAIGWAVLGGFAALRSRSELRAPLAAALAASCVASMFGAPTAGPVFATLLVIAMLVALDTADATSSVPIAPIAIWPLSAPVAVCLAAFAILLTLSDLNLARFQRSSDAAQLIHLYEQTTSAALPGPAEDLYCARRLATASATGPDLALRDNAARVAVRAAARATATSDNPPNAWYNVAMFSAAQNDAAATEKALRTSIALAPNWFKPHWALANVLALNGRDGEARAEAQQALVLDGGKDAEVRQTVKKLTRTPQ
jgi:O-antigen ligase